VIRKADVFKKNLVQSINNEKNIMAIANNPFVVRFYYRWGWLIAFWLLLVGWPRWGCSGSARPQFNPSRFNPNSTLFNADLIHTNPGPLQLPIPGQPVPGDGVPQRRRLRQVGRVTSITHPSIRERVRQYMRAHAVLVTPMTNQITPAAPPTPSAIRTRQPPPDAGLP
jgi:hypothetical protein